VAVKLVSSQCTSLEFLPILAMESASRDSAVLGLRAGTVRDVLSGKRIAICGCGAIGSFVADVLARSGVGSLHLIDPETLRPGNAVRHLLRADEAGVAKADGIRRSILRTGLMDEDSVTTLRYRISSLMDAAALLEMADLVIDATASGPALAMLDDAQGTAPTPFLSVGLFRNGGIARVDRFPLADGEEFLPAIPPTTGGSAWVLEAGCGDPVSPTPPSSVYSAAALTARLSVRLLAGEPVRPTTVEVYEAQPDAPYETVGILD
jgi:molybdopterin/thiamine biosynthesis adenylyltransferase